MTPAILVDERRLYALNTLVCALDRSEPWLAAITEDGQVVVRSTRRVPQDVIDLWRQNPGMMFHYDDPAAETPPSLTAAGPAPAVR